MLKEGATDRGSGFSNPPERRSPEVIGDEEKHPLQVAFGNASDGIDVSAATVVLRHVATESFVDISSAKDKQEPFLA
jgi:hypothetical protein